MVFSSIPQVVTEDRASGAQVIDGSLKFDQNKRQYLRRTPTADGNRRLWTWSGWLKRNPPNLQDIFSAGQESTNDGIYSRLRIHNDSINLRQWVNGSLDSSLISSRVFRDTSAFFHFVMIYDVDNSTNTDKVRWYINGQRVTSFSATDYPGNPSWINSSSKTHTIGGHYDGGGANADSFWDGSMSQVYFLDGTAAGPEEFGYTDPLTNTWRPKKFDIRAEVSKNPNNGTTWSSTTDSGLTYANGVTGIFDGNLSTRGGAPSTNNNYAILTNNVSISCTNGIRIYWNGVGSGQRYIRINGTIELDDGSAQLTPGWSPLSSFSGTINKIEVKSASSGSWSLAAIEVDGYILIDGAPNNSFYLPLDGNTPIGKDQSGNGNDWTPVGFGGSVELPKATGAIPIHNTNDAGTVAKNGVRNDAKTYTVTASGGNYYLDGELKPTLNAVRGGYYTFDYTGATSHPFYLSSLPDGKHNSKAYSVQFDGSGDYLSATGTGTLAASSNWCMECFFYCTGNEGGTYRIMSANEASQSSEYLVMRIRLGQYQFSTDTANSGTINTAVFNEWTHMAFTKEGTTVRGFINGKKIWETTDNNTVTVTNLITGWGYGGEYFPGYISNARFVNGSSVYTADFTPPTTSLTNITNTHLLCCQDNNAATGVISSGSITVSGNAAASQTKQPFLYNSNGDLGVNTGTSNTTKITIPHTAADTLYYYCSAHSGMGSSINVTTDILKADPYAWKCFFACPYAGDEFDVSDQINCNSTASAATNWNSVQGSNGATFYNTSRYFASGGGKNINYAGKQEFNFTGNYRAFTIEFFATPSSGSSDGAPISSKGYYSNYGNWYLRLATTNGGRMNFYSYDGQGSGQNNEFQNLGCTDPNRVHHVVVQRDGSNLMTFILDGVIVGQASNVTRALDDGLQSGLTVGRIPSNNTTNSAHNWYLGYITDLRIYSGLAKYSGSVGDHVFTPPSVTPDILPDTPSGITGKPKLTKITDGAVGGFETASDYLSVAESSDFVFDGDHTIEFFVYHNTLANDSVPYSTGGSGQPDQIYISSAGLINYAYGQTGAISAPAGTIVIKKWQHIAVSRSGTNLRMFVDGKIVASSTNHSSTIGSATNGPRIGARRDGYHPTQGFISNLRVVKGSAVYTSEFTPPTAPLTNVTNTKLLCCQSTTSATAAAVVASNTPILEPFSGAGGAQGGGTTSDYLQVSSSGHSDFSLNGDFTVEWWHYRAAANVNNGFMWTIHDSNTATGLELYWGSGGSALKLYTNGGPNSVTATAATGWHHYAVVRSGNTIKVYYDGTEGGSFTNTNTFSGDVRIGAEYYNGSVTGGMNGPMSQFRLVKGTAVYTSNFTAPTTALTAITNTKLLTLQGSTPFTDNSGTSKTITVNGNIFTEIVGGITANGDAVATTFSPFNDDINTIRGQASGYCTLNPLNIGGPFTLSDGNLKGVSAGSYGCQFSTIGVTSGKWYAETTALGTGSAQACGIARYDHGNTYAGNGSSNFAYVYLNDGRKVTVGDSRSSYGATWATIGDTVGIAFDADNGTVRFYKNGVDQGIAFSTIDTSNGKHYFCQFDDSNATNSEQVWNFGQKPFKFPPPDGFQPLNLSNVQPEKVISRPDQYVGVSLWTGNGTSQNITGLKHKPDLVWSKARSFGADHELYDSVRGTMQRLYSSLPNQEGSSSSGVNSFNADGFGVTGGGGVNNNTSTYVGWTWKAGGNKNTFNIDDVGYANASDVNMNVGALNSSLYNTSRRWSDGIANSSSDFDQAAANAFNGDRSNQLRTAGNSVLVTLNFSPALTVTNNIQILAENYSTANFRYTVTVDGTTTTKDVVGAQPATFNVSGSLTQITFDNNNSNGRTYLQWIKVDGKELIDNNVTINAPSIAPTGCSVNTKSKFGIYTYTGSGSGAGTLNHGLEGTPGLIIYKKRNSSSSWQVYHQSLGGTVYNTLDEDVGDYTSDSTRFGGTNPTSSIITLGTHGNGADDTIMYAWCDVPGLQKFGKWIGNNSADGNFVELGFRPALVIAKESSASGAGAQWFMLDSSRNTYNPLNNILDANRGDGERQGVIYDFLSNGFKIRTTFNSGATFIYMAWAEAPTINLYGAQSNAR